MGELQFIRPTPALQEQAWHYKQEHIQQGELELHGGALLGSMDYGEWLALVEENANSATVHSDWVVADTFFAQRKGDGRLIGMADIRHSLNPFLQAFGGHIGYGVRPSERGRGYGKQILQMALEHARTLGLKQVMSACYQDNEPSRRTIAGAGGVLERTFLHTDGRMV